MSGNFLSLVVMVAKAMGMCPPLQIFFVDEQVLKLAVINIFQDILC